MDNHIEKHEDDMNGTQGFLAGLLVGGLAGAGAMLLLAPQSGKRTRAKIQHQSLELRDQAEDAVAKARVKARQITADVHEQAEELQHHGQHMLDEQKERLSTVVEAGKKKVHDSRN